MCERREVCGDGGEETQRGEMDGVGEGQLLCKRGGRLSSVSGEVNERATRGLDDSGQRVV